MALSFYEATYARAMILHGIKEKAIKEAYPRLEKGFEEAAIRHMMQNPEVRKHIDAGILYVYRDIVSHTTVPTPGPLTITEKQQLLQMVVEGVRETPVYIVTGEGLRMIFIMPDEETVANAKHMLDELNDAEEKAWMM